jgi:hypothetical protein
VLEVLGEIHRGHPTVTQLALDLVAVGEGGLEAFQVIRHRDLVYRSNGRVGRSPEHRLVHSSA